MLASCSHVKVETQVAELGLRSIHDVWQRYALDRAHAPDRWRRRTDARPLMKHGGQRRPSTAEDDSSERGGISSSIVRKNKAHKTHDWGELIVSIIEVSVLVYGG